MPNNVVNELKDFSAICILKAYGQGSKNNKKMALTTLCLTKNLIIQTNVKQRCIVCIFTFHLILENFFYGRHL